MATYDHDTVYNPDNIETLPELRRIWEQNRRADAVEDVRTDVSDNLTDWLDPDSGGGWVKEEQRPATPEETLALNLRRVRTLISRLLRDLEDPNATASLEDARNLALSWPGRDLMAAVERRDQEMRAQLDRGHEQAINEVDLSDEAFDRYRAFLRKLRRDGHVRQISV